MVLTRALPNCLLPFFTTTSAASTRSRVAEVAAAEVYFSLVYFFFYFYHHNHLNHNANAAVLRNAKPWHVWKRIRPEVDSKTAYYTRFFVFKQT